MVLRPLAEYQMLFLSGCSRRVHHIETTTSIDGAIEASKAPRMNRKTARPAKFLNAARMQHETPQPRKQKQIHQLTGNLTRA